MAEREIFHTMVHFPNGFNSWSFARLKPEARRSIRVSLKGSRGPNAWTNIHAALGWIGSKQLGLKLAQIWNVVLQVVAPQHCAPELNIFNEWAD